NAAVRHLVEHGGFRFGESEQFAGIGGLRLGQLHLAKDGADDQDFGIAVDLFANVLPAPALLTLDIEQLFSEVGSLHGSLLAPDGCWNVKSIPNRRDRRRPQVDLATSEASRSSSAATWASTSATAMVRTR